MQSATSQQSHYKHIFVGLLLALLFSLLALATTASADLTFGSRGSGAGQIESTSGVAVDHSNGNVFVADSGNNRIDVFDSAGNFIRAFGWGVEDGTSAELQTCTVTCFKGLVGGGAGEFSREMGDIAVDNDPASPAHHDVYVIDGARIQKFTPAGEFLLTWGGGVITGGAAGSGNLTSGSPTVTGVATTEKAFLVGQTISGAGIPVATRIVGIGPGTITLSKHATASGAGVALNVAEGPGNVPVNEREVIEVSQVAPESPPDVAFATESPSLTEAHAQMPVAPLPPASGPGSLQEKLEGLSNIGPGNVSVSGAAGGPYAVEFKGTRFADTNVNELYFPGVGHFLITPSPNGASSAEICTAAIADSCTAGIKGSGQGQFITRGLSLAVGTGGTVYVSDAPGIGTSETEKMIRIQKFEPSGAYLSQLNLGEGHLSGVGSIALDSGGNIYAAFGQEGIKKYDPNGTLLYILDKDLENGALSVDGADNLFASQRASNFQVLVEYSSGGNILRRFGYGATSSLSDLAAYHSAVGEVFGSEASQVHYFAPPPPGPIVAPPTVEASPIGNAKAALKAKINPEGKAVTYRFDYVSQEGFEEQAGFTGPQTRSTPVGAIGADFTLHSIEAVAGCPNPLTEASEGKCLKPETNYRFRVVAEDSEGHESELEGKPFTTKPPLELIATWASEVGTDSANLGVEVNPLGIPATAYFEYVDDATYQQSGFTEAIQVPNVTGGESEIEFGAGEKPTIQRITLFPLVPDVTYHYRLVLTDPLVEPITSAEHTFTTFEPTPPTPPCSSNETYRMGPSAFLPDCRAYELVSPLDKDNGDLVPLNLFTEDLLATFDRSSTDGARLAYGSYKAFGDAPAAPYTTQYIAARGKDGWVSHAITPPRGRLTLPATGAFDTELKALSPDLCQAWLRTTADPPLAPGAVEGYSNLYRRQDSEPGCGGQGYEAITTESPPNHLPGRVISLELQGIAAGGSAAIYVVADNLTEDAAPQPPECVESEGDSEKEATKCQLRLYERTGEGLSYVCILPSGEASTLPCSAGTNPPESVENRAGSLNNAISADGTRVFWTAAEHGPGKLYVRIDGTETRAVSRQAEELSGTSGSQFWTAAEDGSRAIFTSGEDLYEFDVDSEETTLIAHKSPGLLGPGESASRIYFASREVLSGEEANSYGDKAQAGKPNLYLHEAGEGGEAGSVAFVATLADRDVDPFSKHATLDARPLFRSSHVSPNGRHVAFMSAAPLSGYDNLDAESGKRDVEVYLYDADSHKLLCASCNPNGARPAGSDLEKGPASEFWVAARLPVWENNLYASRVLADDGQRLFFDSTDSLVPRDTNGVEDVYQWEQQGTGGCDEGHPTFVPSSDGCVDLISSGQSPRQSEFVDASPSGNDVFIRTLSSLLPQDYGLVDIYDARVNGGLPGPPTPAPECEGEACQGPATPPNDPTPSSASFRGPGDPRAEKQKKRHAKKHHRKHRRHHRRAAR